MRRLLQQQSSWSQCPKTSLEILCSPPEKASKILAHLYYNSQYDIHML